MSWGWQRGVALQSNIQQTLSCKVPETRPASPFSHGRHHQHHHCRWCAPLVAWDTPSWRCASRDLDMTVSRASRTLKILKIQPSPSSVFPHPVVSVIRLTFVKLAYATQKLGGAYRDWESREEKNSHLYKNSWFNICSLTVVRWNPLILWKYSCSAEQYFYSGKLSIY